jgi:hypothetical protein
MAPLTKPLNNALTNAPTKRTSGVVRAFYRLCSGVAGNLHSLATRRASSPSHEPEEAKQQDALSRFKKRLDGRPNFLGPRLGTTPCPQWQGKGAAYA